MWSSDLYTSKIGLAGIKHVSATFEALSYLNTNIYHVRSACVRACTSERVCVCVLFSAHVRCRNECFSRVQLPHTREITVTAPVDNEMLWPLHESLIA